ncbi:M48 family metalloprotease [Chitinophaga agrisoli]|uniref:M48 family metalloprotease n=1 Tax=Chitinophaga agrisoli TaxID=2607653 RepID=A0A5B2VNM2_9BACT|nr:M48 family metallopeptidase [Chitinophaga agrisoli]KAA2240645.1 M48 family metalloprotease [Chitinophaga agrisoli]
MSNLHPPGIGQVPELLPPSSFFRRQVAKVSGSILIFLVACIFLLCSATVLATACIAGGIILALNMPRVLTIITALALMLLGIMVLVFLVRFLFSRRQQETPCRTLLEPSEHPRLFDFITQLAAATKTRLPERIFAIPGVRANIFYHTGARGGLRPFRRDLEIGLGLVNSLNLGELTMVLAHEFGHFSRRSMQLGNYLQTLQEKIYHRLYENGHWRTTLVKWAGRHVILSLFARMVMWIGNGIQHVLQLLYDDINREYLRLGREMERYADSVALRITGTNTAISAMRRVEMGSICFEHCLHKLPALAAQQRRFRNLYRVHSALLHHYAAQNNMLLDAAQLPLITDDYPQDALRSRIQFRQQEALQPDREERERWYRQAAIDRETDTTSSWGLFNNPEQLQESMTQLVYNREVPEQAPYQWYTPQAFITDLEQRQRQYELPAVFNNYYDDRPFSALTPGCLQPLTPAEQATVNPDTLYATAHAGQIHQLFRNRQDVETLEAIAGGEIQVQAFEFNGKTLSASEAAGLLAILTDETNRLTTWLQAQDCLAFRYHYTQAVAQHTAQTLVQQYQRVLQHQDKAQQLEAQCTMILHCISALFGAAGITVEEALPWFEMLEEESRIFRNLLQELWQHPDLTPAIDAELEQRIRQYLQQPDNYLDGHTPKVAEIQVLHDVSAAMLEVYNGRITVMKKGYLEMVVGMEGR